MNGRPASILITGMVQGLDATGIGPNSGEITFIIKTDAGPVVEVFAGILGSSNPSANGIEQGVYASYVSIALTAMTTGRSLTCSYLPLDKYRVNYVSIRP